MNRRLIILAAAVLMPLLCKANVSLPALFSDGMVLQQNRTIEVWGWAKPFEDVTVKASWDGKEQKIRVGNNSCWSVKLQTPAASQQSYTIDIQGYNHITISDVLVGEVILCSGQSNMEWQVGQGFEGSEAVIAAASQNDIRMFNVDYRVAAYPTHNVSGCWQKTTPESVKSFSAIGYVMAVDMAKSLGIPIGIINSSWGGTPVECWTPEASFTGNADLKALADRLPETPWGPKEPGVIYNAMVAPFARYAIAGIAWYQGEANCDNAEGYAVLLSEYVARMRELFASPSLPFVYAQIAPYKYGSGAGVMVRDQQRLALQKIENSAMVVIGDIGNPKDIHPRKKLEAGKRFAAAMLSEFYGKKEFHYAAPLFDKAVAQGKKVVVSFANADGLKVSEGKTPDMFELAGADGVFHTAKATIKNGTVVLTCKEVPAAQSVRFAWSDDAMPNLVNAWGIQASSFKADVTR